MIQAEAVYHGVDFSGAKRHRNKIWVATRRDAESATTCNGFSHRGVVDLIRSSAKDGRVHCWLVDAPFNLPIAQLDAHGIASDWRATLDWMASFSDARDWRRACRKVSRIEHRRAIDRRVHTPFSPVNLRMFKQTWHWMVLSLIHI